MDRRDLSDLLIFQAVAEAGSFTRAAAKIGRAQSGVSQTISELEARLNVPLLARSTRSVRLTEAGQRLLEQVAPALRQISDGLDIARAGQDGLTGTLRLTAVAHAAKDLLVPALPSFLEAHPNVSVDLHVSDKFVDVVAEGFDAGVRLGSHLEQDMISLPLGPNIETVVVGSPAYFARRGRPQSLEDLAEHTCIGARSASHGDIFAWPFQQAERRIEMRIDPQFATNDASILIEAAQNGLGLVCTFAPLVAAHLETGTLEPCLEPHCVASPGYHIYYPSRRQKSAALTELIKVLELRRKR
ncbi:MAG: LysR family transcriptional regulator [Pelagimonas sp.]|uniref:LysR family transcriptional regulator n=1 Tax=Pelagimonas sp. TaxID=2073170 RepID=UPI003D6B54B8